MIVLGKLSYFDQPDKNAQQQIEIKKPGYILHLVGT